MEKELHEKVRKQLEKTGYPLELKIGNVMLRHGFTVQHNRYYLDKDENKGREVDVLAFIRSETKKSSFGLHFVVQIKYSREKPWVILSTQRDVFEGAGWLKLIYCSQGIESVGLMGEEIEENSTLSEFSRLGRSYCECSQAEKDEKRAIFEELTSVVKAAEYCLEKEGEAARKLEKQPYLHFVEPVIILDGLLYEAYLDTKGDLVLRKINHIPVSFGYISGVYERYQYVVDLLTFEHLPTFLSSKRKWLHSLQSVFNTKLATVK